MNLTKEQQEIYDGKQGATLAKVMQTLVRYGELFGADGWELAWAYGDHHSDRAMLAAAKSAYAVTPDRPLTRTANAQGYDILDW